jgi:hypothetical protein
MNTPIDPVQFGKLIAQVQHLSEQLERAQASMNVLSERLGEVEDRYKVGKAAAFGAVLVLGAAVYGIKDIFARMIGALTP